MKAMKVLLILIISSATTLADIQWDLPPVRKNSTTTQCNSNNHCPEDKACIMEKCLDPCVGICGNNTQCKVRNHNPSCACMPGYTGDPFNQCDPLCLPLPMDVPKKTIKKFIPIDQELSFFEALKYCLKNKMQPASIENEEEEDQLKPLMLEGTSYWTSGYLTVPWIFYWINTGKKVTYSNWSEGNPSGSSMSCLIVRQSGLANRCCSEVKPFFCQYYE